MWLSAGWIEVAYNVLTGVCVWSLFCHPPDHKGMFSAVMGYSEHLIYFLSAFLIYSHIIISIADTKRVIRQAVMHNRISSAELFHNRQWSCLTEQARMDDISKPFSSVFDSTFDFSLTSACGLRSLTDGRYRTARLYCKRNIQPKIYEKAIVYW